MGDLVNGHIYVFPSSGGNLADATVLPQANFGPFNLSSLVFGKGGELYATLWGPGQDGRRPELVQLDPASGAEVRVISSQGDGLPYCPGRPAVNPKNGDLYVPAGCKGRELDSNSIVVVANPNQAHPTVARLAALPSAVGGLAVAPDGTLFAESGSSSPDEPVLEVTGPRGSLLAQPVLVGKVPNGFSYGLVVSRTGRHGAALDLQVADWEGDVYTISLGPHPPGPVPDLSTSGVASSGRGHGLAWGLARHRGCLYLPAGPAIERSCPAGGDLASLARSLPTPAKVFKPLSADVVNGALAVAGALVLMFLAGTFNHTVAENYADIRALWVKWADRLAPPRSKRRERQWTFGMAVAGGAVLGSSLSAGFGLNIATLLCFVAIAGALLGAVALQGLVKRSCHRARSRGREPVQEQAYVVVLGSLARLATGLAAWLLWAGTYHIADHAGSFFGAVLATDFLAAYFVTALVSTVVCLVPLWPMPGYHLKNWHVSAWLVAFVASLFLVVQVLLAPGPTGTSWTGESDLPLIATLVLLGLAPLAARWRARPPRSRSMSAAAGNK